MKLETKIEVLEEMINTVYEHKYLCNTFSSVMLQYDTDNFRRFVTVRANLELLFPELYMMIIHIDNLLKYNVVITTSSKIRLDVLLWHIPDGVNSTQYRQDKLKELIIKLKRDATRK